MMIYIGADFTNTEDHALEKPKAKKKLPSPRRQTMSNKKEKSEIVSTTILMVSVPIWEITPNTEVFVELGSPTKGGS